MTRRYLALWFPFLPTDRARRDAARRRSVTRDDAPFVLVDKDRGALRIAALNRAATAANLRIGMSLTDARAWIPDLRVEEAGPQADADLLSDCAAAAEMFTPLVALDGDDGLMLDITGCAHLFGGEAGFTAEVHRRFRRLGLATRVTIAGTPDAAHAFVRFSQADIVAPGGEADVARGLPVSALGTNAETLVALTRAGLKTLGDLADRPSRILSARFGPDMAVRLDRILGRDDIRIVSLRPAPDFLAERHFPEPLGAMEGLLAVLGSLAGDLDVALERNGRGGRVFEAVFFRSDGGVRRVRIELAQASRDAATLMRLLRLKLETLADPLDPGFGFDALRLAVLASEPLAPVQRRFDGSHAEEGALTDLVDRLVTRFGRDQVLRFVARDTHDPVRAGASQPVLAKAGAVAWQPAEPGQPPARPLTLFDPPQWIETLAEVPDGPPLRFRWRRVLHDVARAEGPERIAPEWWQEGAAAPATRDYYRIEDGNGRRFWVFREGFYDDSTARPRWFLHGLFA